MRGRILVRKFPWNNLGFWCVLFYMCFQGKRPPKIHQKILLKLHDANQTIWVSKRMGIRMASYLSEGRECVVGSVLVDFRVFGAPRFSVQRPQNTYSKGFGGLWTENRGAPKTRKPTTTDPTPHSRLSAFEFEKLTQESPRQTKPNKGPKRKVHEFRPFLWILVFFSLGKQARFIFRTFVPECPCEKFMNWPSFGLVCRGHSWLTSWCPFISVAVSVPPMDLDGSLVVPYRARMRCYHYDSTLQPENPWRR